jgi:esterase/lipase superfamily enzyme
VATVGMLLLKALGDIGSRLDLPDLKEAAEDPRLRRLVQDSLARAVAHFQRLHTSALASTVELNQAALDALWLREAPALPLALSPQKAAPYLQEVVVFPPAVREADRREALLEILRTARDTFMAELSLRPLRLRRASDGPREAEGSAPERRGGPAGKRRKGARTPPPSPSMFAGPPEAAHGFTVWYGTNRKPDPDRPGRFTGDRDRVTHYGQCRVCVPRSHAFGEAGSSWWQRVFVLRDDDRLRIVQRRPSPDGLAFWGRLRATLEEASPGERAGLIYLHGYCVTFDNAALRAAQLGYDLRMSGATAFFSWPSRGDLGQYPADEASIEASEDAIADFLTRFVVDSGATTVHVIAHSMGNRGLLRAAHRIAARAGRAGTVRFGQLILAAPDVDVDVFQSLGPVYPTLSERTTLYFSRRDRAVEISQRLHRFDRVGYAPPITVLEHIDSIEVTNVNFSLLGHGYYAEASDLLHDIYDLIVHNHPPEARGRLSPLFTDTGKRYWTFAG